MTATLTPLVNSVHALPHGSKALRRTRPNQWVDLTLGVAPKKVLPDLSAIEKLLPRERKYLTRQQLADEYGSDSSAVDQIEAFAKAHNLVVSRDHSASARIGLGGTAADLSAAFGVTLFDYSHATLGHFHARTGPVQLPAELVHAVTGVFGFNTQRILRRIRTPGSSTAKSAASQAKAHSWFSPPALEPIYNFPPAAAASTRQCIGILEFGGGVEMTDVTSYFSYLKMPAPTVKVIALDGVSTDPTADPDTTAEVMLDVDVCGAMSGGATLVVYFSTFYEKGLVDALSAVISDSTNDPSVLSISYGWDENQQFNNQGIIWSPAAIGHVNQSLLAIAHLGITTCVSTGDDGSEAQMQDGKAHVNFPATSPYVLAVGGTTLHVKTGSKGATTITETVWNDGPGSGTGGGISDYIPVPTWQEGIVPKSINPGHFAGRGIPDVAANADPATGYQVMFGGKLQIVGGTSAAAPLWAALICRINSQLGSRAGNFNALLYSKFGPAKVLRDITSGNNDTDGLLEGQFKAGPGWDACTGWGAPDGQKLLAALKGN